ncbi:MAG: Slp family lipoprotein [Gammaproteobacteria bacterium]|nr:Slp family lipoprotein [Gammaproteobacteria bacterium]
MVSAPEPRILFALLAAAITTSCASHIPVEIRQAPANNPPIETVQEDPLRFTGQYVRWGGKIVDVENKPDSTWIEVVSSSLNSYGRPVRYEHDTPGRFLVRIDGFIDPEIYGKGRLLTVYGNVESRLVRQIDDYPYTYPLIKANTHYLWPEYRHSQYRHYAGHPYYLDPWWYYPHYRFHYGHRHFYRHHYGLHYGHRYY